MFGSLPICRVCLKPSLEYIDFDTPFEVDASLSIQVIDNDLTYLDCFQACTRLEIEFNENCPQSLCSSCGLELKVAYEFLQKAEAADKVLRELASRTKVEKPDDEESKYYLQPDVMMEQNDNVPNEETTSKKEEGMEGQLDDEKTFVCTICGEQFFSQMVLNIHVNRSHSNNQIEEQSAVVGKVECHVCDMVVSLDNLHAHMQIHGEESNYEVNEEPINEDPNNEEVVMDDPDDEYEVFDTTNNFSDEEAINVNDSQEDEESPHDNYEPVDPDEEEMLLQVKDESKMKTNTRTKRPGSDLEAKFDVVEKILTDQEKQRKSKANYKQCEICQKLVRKTSFDAHMNVHNGALKFPCDYCFQGYFSKRALQKHVRATHTEMVKAVCKICNESIDSPTMKEHIEEKHSHVIKCTECNFECPELKMKEHVNRKHSQTKDFLCNVCSKTFRRLSTLRSHLRTHMEDKDKDSLPCDVCGNVYPSLQHLKIHKKIHDKTRRPFSCADCGKLYLSQSALYTHRKWHTGETFKCINCPKLFVNKAEYKIHLRFHTHDFPHHCEMCGKKFNAKGHLNAHIKMHLGWKLRCKECGKLFATRSAYSDHMFKHSDMPYKCLHCPKGYPTRTKLRYHLKATHSMDMTMEELKKIYVEKPTVRVREKVQWIKVDPQKED